MDCRLSPVALLLVAMTGPAEGQSHGPAFGLATPTLARGGWSLDLGLMNRWVDGHQVIMGRPMVSYGITEDLQLSLSVPVPVRTLQEIAPARATARMPATPDVEVLVGWRFHRQGTDVGSRFESTAWAGLDYPTDAIRAGTRTAPGLYGAVVTGYASRSVYLWVGGLYRRYMTPSGATADHPGDLGMYSVVVGWRPPPFQKDYPHPDWRVFVEAVGEVLARDVVGGTANPDSGGHRLFLGPTLLGLYGWWGISGGPLFPVIRRLHGDQPEDDVRVMINLTFWF